MYTCSILRPEQEQAGLRVGGLVVAWPCILQVWPTSAQLTHTSRAEAGAPQPALHEANHSAAPTARGSKIASHHWTAPTPAETAGAPLAVAGSTRQAGARGPSP